MATASHEAALYVLAAPYETVAAASADCEAIDAVHREGVPARPADVLVLERDDFGQVLLPDGCEVRLGLALGVAASLFPAIGVGAALSLGTGGGAAVGALVGYVHADIAPEELRQLAEMLDAAGAGLIAVYDEPLAAAVESAVSSPSTSIIRASSVDVDRLLREAGSVTDPALTKR